MMKSLLARLLFPYESIRRVLFGPLQGYQYVVQPGMGLTYALGYGAGNDFLADRVEPGEVVFDVGGNRGQFALFFAELVGEEGLVVSFEPVEELADFIRQNASLNDLSNLEVVAAAAAKDEGTATFQFSESLSTQGQLAGTEPEYSLPDASAIEVQTLSIDEIVGNRFPAPDLMKIDVEGGAQAVFEGARNTLSECSPDIYIELHGPEEQQAVKHLLENFGYMAKTLDGSRVENPTDGWFSPLWLTRR